MTILGVIASSTRQGQATDLGAMFPLQVVTVGGTGVSSISFSNIPNTYTHLQIRASGLFSSGNNVIVQYNGDTGTNYVNQYFFADGASTSAGQSGTNNGSVLMWSNATSGSNPVVTVFDVLDYKNTNKYKVSRTIHGRDANGSGYVEIFSGLWLSTSAISSIVISAFGSTINPYSTFALYGIKSA